LKVNSSSTHLNLGCPLTTASSTSTKRSSLSSLLRIGTTDDDIIVDPVAPLILEPVLEPVVEPVLEPVLEPVVEPVLEHVFEPANVASEEDQVYIDIDIDDDLVDVN